MLDGVVNLLAVGRLSNTARAADVALSDTLSDATVSSSLVTKSLCRDALSSSSLPSDFLSTKWLLSPLLESGLAHTLATDWLLGAEIMAGTLTGDRRVAGRTGTDRARLVVMLASNTSGGTSRSARLSLGGEGRQLALSVGTVLVMLTGSVMCPLSLE